MGRLHAINKFEEHSNPKVYKAYITFPRIRSVSVNTIRHLLCQPISLRHIASSCRYRMSHLTPRVWEASRNIYVHRIHLPLPVPVEISTQHPLSVIIHMQFASWRVKKKVHTHMCTHAHKHNRLHYSEQIKHANRELHLWLLLRFRSERRANKKKMNDPQRTGRVTPLRGRICVPVWHGTRTPNSSPPLPPHTTIESHRCRQVPTAAPAMKNDNYPPTATCLQKNTRESEHTKHELPARPNVSH